MSQKTDSQLNSEKNVIKNENDPGENSATRVGEMLENIIDSKINNDRIDTSVNLDGSGKDVADRDAVKTYINNLVSNSVSSIEVLYKTISQTTHGFTVNDVVRVNDSGTYSKISDPSTQFRVGLVTSVSDANTFRMAIHGYVSGLSGFTAGAVYYAQTDGTMGTTVTDMPVLHADTTTSGYLIAGAYGGGGGEPDPEEILFGDTEILFGDTEITFND